MAEDDRPRFLPPTADPPRFGVAGLPAPPPSPPASHDDPFGAGAGPAATGRNYSPADPGLARRRVAAEPDPQQANGCAVASLTLSVLGLGLLIVSFGLLCFLSLPCSALGWLFGHRARERAGDQGMAQGGLVTGIVGTVLSIAALVVWVALILAADGSWNWD